MAPYFIERHRGGERAILVHIYFPYQDEGHLPEFQELVKAAQVSPLALVTGKRSVPNPKYFVGTGKADEILQQVKALSAEVVLLNHELSPAQGRNLEKLFGCRVLDRTELILDIFAQRARTFEGKLQVELAQLQHLSTCLVKGWSHLERQKGGIGLRGPGETQLETDRRLVSSRIKMIEKRLEKVMSQRHQQRRSRQKAALPTVSLVGYTNAGKSTLFNQLTESEVYVADQLFATLDPTLRYRHFPHLGKVILADTVGFIRDLPHTLIAAFKATLEETRQADLLLHVIDVTADNIKEMIQNVTDVLKEIDAESVPQLQVYNKIDCVEGFTPRVDYWPDGKPKRVWVSALTGEGFELLTQSIVNILGHQLMLCRVVLNLKEGKLRAALYELGVVLEESLSEEGEWVLQLNIQRRDYERLIVRNSR